MAQDEVIRYRGDTTDFDKAVKRVNKSSKSVGTALKGLGSIVGGVAASYLSFRGIMAAVDAYKQQQVAVTRLNNAFDKMGRDGGTIAVLRKQASALQKEGLFGDEMIIAGQAILATYPKITDDLMPKATQVMVDFAAQTGASMETAAKILGRASDGMVGSMAEYGISLSDATKESKDFGAIMADIETQVGGANKVLGQTATGGVEQLKNAFGDFMESAGELLLGTFQPAVRAATEAITDLTDAFSTYFGLHGKEKQRIAQIDKEIQELQIRQISRGYTLADQERAINALLRERQGLRDKLKEDEAAVVSTGGGATGTSPTTTTVVKGKKSGSKKTSTDDPMRRELERTTRLETEKWQRKADIEEAAISQSWDREAEREAELLARMEESMEQEADKWQLKADIEVAATSQKYERIAAVEKKAQEDEAKRKEKHDKRMAKGQQLADDVFTNLANLRNKKLAAIGRIGMIWKQAVATADAIKAGSGLPFPGNLAAIASGVAAVVSNFSALPKFNRGGIVPGGAPYTDRVNASLTPGEAVLPQPLTELLMNAAGAGEGDDDEREPLRLEITLNEDAARFIRAQQVAGSSTGNFR